MTSVTAIGPRAHDRSADGDDRDAELDGASAVQPLLTALDQLRLSGAVFFRSELTEPFAFQSNPLTFAGALHPGAQRVIIFHIVASGSCWVTGDDGVRQWAQTGDVIVLPYGDRHTIGGDTPADAVPITSLLAPLPWTDLPTLRHGGGGRETELVCGYLHSDDPLFDPSLRALPSAFVVRLHDRGASEWVAASVAYAADHMVPSSASSNPITTRLPELVLIDVLRAHLATAPVADHGWLAALGDPVLAAALAALHAHPERAWTVADLAREVAVSRSVLDDRFRTVLGRAPIRYLTEWRLHLAANLLATTNLTVVAVARRVGYESEEAFSRAFKRAHGASPAHWRARGSA